MMKKSVWKDMNLDWFFVTSGLAAYVLGAFVANRGISNWDLISFFAGILLFLTIYILQRYTQTLSTPTAIGDTYLSSGKQNTKPAQYIPAFFLLTLIFTALYFLLKQQVLIGINLIWLSLISIFIFIQTTPRLGNALTPAEWIFKSLSISPLLVLLGISLQAHPLEGLHYLMATPLFFLTSASLVALEFPIYAKAPNENKARLIPRIGLEITVVLHRVLVLLTYISLGAYLYFSGSFRANWSLLLIALISLFQMYLLNRITLGMKPNYGLLKATAYLQTLTFFYLLILNLII